MNIFLTGADGFLGLHLSRVLFAAGHAVTGGARHGARFRAAFPNLPFAAVDFTTAVQPDAWAVKLRGFDAVINAVGIFREGGRQTFDAVHTRAPIALFEGARRAGVTRVIQISALGADESARSRYHVSKRAADEYLARLDVEWSIVQPSLVYGPGGASARFFNMLATLPLMPLPGGGRQLIQPVHIDDVSRGILALLERRLPARIPFVGPEALTLRDYLAALRAALGMGAPRYITVPRGAMRAAAAVGDRLGGLLTSDALAMLERGNTGDPAAITQLLGRPPRRVRDFVPADRVAAMRQAAKLAWLLPLLAASIAFVWIASGVVSLGIFPIAESYALLARAGVPALLMPLMLYGAAFLDIAIGVGILVLRRRRWLWIAQLLLILGYTAIITVALPEFWLHPYGPVTKNLPMLAGIALLLFLEE